MTSKLTRERLEKIKSWRETYGAGSNVMLPAEEAEELASIALAAMDSESGCLPLDYLQGHKDGLEWAAQLAEANHPETGDWLYDDPIELAKAIRKGPDMPPAQPVADSEPVIVVGDDGGDALSYRRLIQSFEPGTKLYRHAQPAPVVQKVMSRLAYLLDEDQFHNIESMVLAAGIHPAGTSQVIPEVMSMEELQYKPLTKSWREGWNACRAAMLSGGKP